VQLPEVLLNEVPKIPDDKNQVQFQSRPISNEPKCCNNYSRYRPMTSVRAENNANASRKTQDQKCTSNKNSVVIEPRKKVCGAVSG
jgi:hypothetical protein